MFLGVLAEADLCVQAGERVKPLPLFGEPMTPNQILEAHHYLGPIWRGTPYQDEAGVLVFGAPTSRRLPVRWLELLRWCITDRSKNAGSRQWRAVRRWLLTRFPDATTVVSYSDPSQGHDGALYRACNWLWAPTWHRLRTPPTGNGSWGKRQEAAKDRWVFPLRRDDERAAILAIQDDAVIARFPFAQFPGDFKRWRREAAC